MAVQTGKDTSRASAEELAAIGRGRRGSFVQLLVGFLVTAGAILVLSTSISRLATNSSSLEDARSGLVSMSNPAVRQFVKSQREYQAWIERYGLSFEENFFEELSEVLFSQVVSASTHPGESRPGFFRRIYISLLSGLDRVFFVLVAVWKPLILLVGFALFRGRQGLSVYQGVDFLGTLSNGRIFYSGIKGKLHRLSVEGAPDVHVKGLACPATVSPSIAKQSALTTTLKAFGAQGATNEELVSVILGNADVPAYVAIQSEQTLLDQSFIGASLDAHAGLVLRSVLTLHQSYRRGLVADQDIGPVQGEAATKGRMSHEAFGELLARTLHRVLTPKMRHDLAKISPKQIATVALSLEAGKVLAFSRESARWYRLSNFPHLCARAVLHSRDSYSREYVYRDRQDIRRSIIYSSRRSIYAPVRFPVDLSEGVVALRQWTEVLLACPHEIASVGDDVELYGMMSEAHGHFKQALFEGVSVRSPDIMGDACVVGGRLLVMPISRIVAMFRRSLGPDTVQRLEELVAAVYQRERLEQLAEEKDIEGTGNRRSVAYSLPRPLTQTEIAEEAKVHSVSVEDVREWSTLNAVLSSFGWIAQRIGEDSVPDSSLCRLILKVGQDWTDRNSLGLVSRSGVVPLRAFSVEEKLGRMWAARFRTAEYALLAGDDEDLARKLAGVEEQDGQSEDPDSVGVAS